LLEIPRLKISSVVLSGENDAVLDVAIGHLTDTPVPWEPGNSAFAAHRDGLFRPLKGVRIGDEIRLRSAQGDFSYRVRETKIVNPDDLSVLAATPTQTLTLITCYPFNYVGSAPQRFVVHADKTKNEELRTKNGTKNGTKNEELRTELRTEQRTDRATQVKRSTKSTPKPTSSRSKLAKTNQSKSPTALAKKSTLAKSSAQPTTPEKKKRPRFLRWLLGS
jgi:LPXTG-site transpeptidase (sortase) family protein